MSDDEVKYVKKQKVIHYGSLEDSEMLRPDKIEASNETEKAPSLPAPNGKQFHRNYHFYSTHSSRIHGAGGCHVSRQTSTIGRIRT